MRLLFDTLFDSCEWRRNWCLDIDDRGVIIAARAATDSDVQESTRIAGCALPGFINVHSHAFQRAMAGLSEFRTHAHDSFWTWRQQMYQLVEQITPPEQYRVARLVYAEMLRAGYTSVGEFHYLHHDQHGHPYADPLAMSTALVQAAQEVGIRICYLPVLYQHSGFGTTMLSTAQQRFFLDGDAYQEHVAEASRRWSNRHDFHLGLAAHSLRAVRPATLAELFGVLMRRYPDAPMHIHVAEQLQEVEECQEIHGCRPIELLCERCEVDERWCLIHATHVSESELNQIVERRAAVGLCPSTEANLGDGIFPAAEYARRNGIFAIGSDSQVTIDPRAECRWLEYVQRLMHKERCLLADGERSVGRFVCEAAWHGGRQSLRMPIGKLQAGDLADFVVLDVDHPTLNGREQDRLLDAFIFCEAGSAVRGVYVGGQKRWPNAGIE